LVEKEIVPVRIYYTIIGKSGLGCDLRRRLYIFVSGLYLVFTSSFGLYKIPLRSMGADISGRNISV